MKTAFKYVLTLICALSWAVACVRDDGFDARLAERFDGPCLIVKGATVFSFEETSCQESYRPSQKLYRAGTDTMSDFFSVKMSAVPSSEGQKLTCTLSWTGVSKETVQDRLSFSVQEIRGDLIWLWCSRQQIAVAVRILQ